MQVLLTSRAALLIVSLVVVGVAHFAATTVAQDDPFGGGDVEVTETPAGSDPFGEPRPQRKPPTPKPEEPLLDATRPIAPPPSGFEVELLDGTLLRGELDVAEVAVATKYGQLQIPLTELQSIAPGLNTRAAQKLQFARLIEQLGSEAYAERQQAQAELIALGPQVIEIVRAATNSDNAERMTRAKAILETFAALEQTWGPSGAVPLSELDEVTTSEFTASGQVQLTQITVEGVYGAVTVDLQHVKRLRRTTAIRPSETFATTKVAGEHITLLKPHNSQIMVRRGDTVSIRASGTIKAPNSGYVFRPEGSANFGVYNEAQRIMNGALLVQVGERGETKLAGGKNSFIAEADGPLYFSIAVSSSYARQNLEGNYEVNVRVSSAK